MPIYEYECTSCGKKFEIQQKMTDPSIQSCDQLGCAEAKPVSKIISAPAIMFKGTGWYVTDYSDKLKDPETKSENKGEKTEVSGSSTQSTDGKGNSDSKSSTESSSSASESGSTSGNSASGKNSMNATSSSSSSTVSTGSDTSTPKTSSSSKT